MGLDLLVGLQQPIVVIRLIPQVAIFGDCGLSGRWESNMARVVKSKCGVEWVEGERADTGCYDSLRVSMNVQRPGLEKLFLCWSKSAAISRFFLPACSGVQAHRDMPCHCRSKWVGKRSALKRETYHCRVKRDRCSGSSSTQEVF